LAVPNRASELVWDETSEAVDGGLTRSAIVRAAIAIADSEGLDAVSMRRVAAALDVRPMSLYTHVASKDDLLDLMLNEVVAEVLVPEPLPDDWREAMRVVADASYRAFVAHAWALEAFGRRPHVGPNVLRHAEQSAAAIAPLGLGPDEAWLVLGIVDEFTLGHAVRGMTFDEESVRRRLREIDPAVYPNLARLGYPGTTDAEQAFEQGLEVVLDGIARRYARL
jgi:AcrR family transcriptional regulator